MPNVKYPVLMGLLEYIYSGQTTLHKDWAEQLYFVAQAYEMPGIYLFFNISHVFEELQQICEEIIDDKGITRHGSQYLFMFSLITDEKGFIHITFSFKF